MFEFFASRPSPRVATLLFVLAAFALAGSAGVDRASGYRYLRFQQVGLELAELEQLQASLEEWRLVKDVSLQEQYSKRVAEGVRRLMRNNPDAAMRDRLLRIDTLVHWAQSLRAKEPMAEDLAKQADLSQTQHRLRSEIQAMVARLEAMQASVGEEARLFEWAQGGLLLASCAMIVSAAIFGWRGGRKRTSLAR